MTPPYFTLASTILTVYFSDSIFFDGFLPLDKSGVRKARLEASLKQLWTFHAVFLDGFHISKGTSHPSPITTPPLFDPSRSIATSLRGLPIPAFLVPVVIDALQDSEYASVTAIVPDEADSFCAGAACKTGGIILTNDSDLLVYDLGQHGAVAFFSQLELGKDEESSGKCEIFRAFVSQPLEIARRLGLENLKQFSFELLRDSSLSLNEIVKRAKQQMPEPLPYDTSRQKTFHEYCKDYEIKTFDFAAAGSIKEMRPICENGKSKFLDPRISELILSRSSLPSFYLPLLVEDPSRASAWNISRDLRQFAYSCLNFNNISDSSSPESIMEYTRRGQRIEPDVIQTLPKKKIISYTNKLIAGLEKFISSFREFPNPIIWKTFAISEILHQYAETQKPAPSRSALSSQFTGQVNRKITWLHIHLSAQIEAVLYSIRMLKQILHYHFKNSSESLAQHPSSSSSSSHDDCFSHLRVILDDTFPPLNQLLLPSRLELLKQPQPASLLSLPPTNIDHLLDLLLLAESRNQPSPPPATASPAADDELKSENKDFSDPGLRSATDGFQTVVANKKGRKKLSQQKQENPRTTTTSTAKMKDSAKKSYSINSNIFDALLES